LRIGDLARLGGVSVRMLRHYHEIGLLVPDKVDDWTGYRSYGEDKLEALRFIVTLKDLGIELAVIRQIMQQQQPSAYLHTVLIARRKAIVAEISDSRSMLAGVDRQLEFTASPSLYNDPEQKPMTTITVEVKPTEPRLVAQLSAVSESWAATDIGPVIQPLYPELIARMAKANVAAVGPSTAWYEDTEEGRLLVHATISIGELPQAELSSLRFDITELPGIEKVASTIHRGTMDTCDATYQALLRWIDDNGYRPIGYGREIDIECDPNREWVTELQIAIEPARSS